MSEEHNDKLTADRNALFAELKIALGIIEWMSGSQDFSSEGQAHEGWLKIQSDLERMRGYCLAVQ